ncbi:MAG: Glycosyl transferases group 1 [Candidatus Kentron sp. G]|nr:MAG: Glycosyl transferases group 1 [Candidatus Kentron sp. G]VFM99341.1 MAG: Glycosyl transferases group 1 [Candidatus Kentron sp. G]
MTQDNTEDHPRVLVAQLGARRHYAVARALHGAGSLERLVTDACAEIPPWKWLNRFIPASWRPGPLGRLLGRRVADVPAEKIRGFALFTLSSPWRYGRALPPTDFWARRNAAFGRLVVKKGLGAADTVYGYNGAALEIFERARREGRRTILDQTAAPWRWNKRLLEEERDRWPGWEEHPAEMDASGALSAREEMEWTLADRIICGSAFAASALSEMGGPGERCAVVPYPEPVSENNTHFPSVPRERRAGDPLHVLFVGTLQLRKGIPYLLEAKRLLRREPIIFRLVGPSVLSEAIMGQLRREMELVGTVPRAEVAKHYAWADIFVLPTLSEGSANVCYEAMAARLPVITTPNAGAGIVHEENGLLVPIRDAESIAMAISRIAHSRISNSTISRGRDVVCPKPGFSGSGDWRFSQYSARLRQAMVQ